MLTGVAISMWQVERRDRKRGFRVRQVPPDGDEVREIFRDGKWVPEVPGAPFAIPETPARLKDHRRLYYWGPGLVGPSSREKYYAHQTWVFFLHVGLPMAIVLGAVWTLARYTPAGQHPGVLCLGVICAFLHFAARTPWRVVVDERLGWRVQCWGNAVFSYQEWHENSWRGHDLEVRFVNGDLQLEFPKWAAGREAEIESRIRLRLGLPAPAQKSGT